MESVIDSGQDAAREAWMLLFQLFRSQRREMMAMKNELQLNPAQVHLLFNLEPGQAVPMSELAESLVLDASYITGLVDRMEERGLLQRQPSPSDRRVKLISLTAEGMAVREMVHERVSQPPPFIAGLPPEDLVALRDIFQRATQLVQTPS
jgi:DNA-binding MarR family transcriptional regulator